MNLQTPGPITASPSYNFSDTWVSYIKTEKELPDELFGKPLHQNIAQTRYSHKYGKGEEALPEADASAQLLANAYNLLDALARRLDTDANQLAIFLQHEKNIGFLLERIETLQNKAKNA